MGKVPFWCVWQELQRLLDARWNAISLLWKEGFMAFIEQNINQTTQAKRILIAIVMLKTLVVAL